VEEAIRRALRITTDALNDEIRDNIDYAKADLQRCGIDINIQNPLIQKAVELYCKWQFNFCDRGEQFRASYEGLRDSIRLSTLEDMEV
jgi:hypothetical protein